MGSQQTPVLEQRPGEADLPGSSPPTQDMSAPSAPTDAEGAMAGPLLVQGSLGRTGRCADVLWVQELGCTRSWVCLGEVLCGTQPPFLPLPPLWSAWRDRNLHPLSSTPPELT